MNNSNGHNISNMQEQILRFFENYRGGFLDIFFEGTTIFGEQFILIGISAYLYWNISKKQGFLLMIVALSSTLLNDILKNIFQTTRPFLTLKNFESLRIQTADGYSFPSGHTQGSTSFYSTLAIIVKRKWFWGIATILIILIGISRLWLGVHWPEDVVGGWMIGLIFPLIFYPFLSKIFDDKNKFNTTLLVINIIAIITLITYIFLDNYYPETTLQSKSLYKIVAILTSVSFGFTTQERLINFKIENSNLIKIIRFAIGFITTILILIGLKFAFPESNLFTFIRYSLVGLWITFIFPYLGQKIKLF